MSIIKTGNKAHDDALLKAEHDRQVAQVPGASQATVRAADLAYLRACLASCKTNNGGAGAGFFLSAIRELGFTS